MWTQYRMKSWQEQNIRFSMRLRTALEFASSREPMVGQQDHHDRPYTTE